MLDEFTWDFSVGSSDEHEARYKAAQFQGYSQELPDGIDPIDSNFDIVCEAVTIFECTEIMKFLRFYMKQRQPFRIWDPDFADYQWVDCQSFRREYIDVGARKLTITLRKTVRL